MITFIFSLWQSSLQEFRPSLFFSSIKENSRKTAFALLIFLKKFWWLFALELILSTLVVTYTQNKPVETLSNALLVLASQIVFFIMRMLLLIFLLDNKHEKKESNLQIKIADYLHLCATLIIAYSVLIFFAGLLGIQTLPSAPQILKITKFFLETIFCIRWLSFKNKENDGFFALLEKTVNDFFYHAPYFFTLAVITIALFSFVHLPFNGPVIISSFWESFLVNSANNELNGTITTVVFSWFAWLFFYSIAVSELYRWIKKHNYSRYTNYIFQNEP